MSRGRQALSVPNSNTDNRAGNCREICIARNANTGHVIAAKVTIVGVLGSGKTALALRFCRGTFEDNLKTTIAVDWFHRSVTLPKRKVNLQIWDTAGQEKFRSVVPSFLRASTAVLLVYDVANWRSFEAASWWLSMVREEVPRALVVLVANKVDRPDRVVTTREGEAYARQEGLDYTETSALTGQNVEELFLDIASRINDTFAYSRPEEAEKVTLTTQVKRKRKCSC